MALSEALCHLVSELRTLSHGPISTQTFLDEACQYKLETIYLKAPQVLVIWECECSDSSLDLTNRLSEDRIGQVRKRELSSAIT